MTHRNNDRNVLTKNFLTFSFFKLKPTTTRKSWLKNVSKQLEWSLLLVYVLVSVCRYARSWCWHIGWESTLIANQKIPTCSFQSTWTDTKVPSESDGMSTFKKIMTIKIPSMHSHKFIILHYLVIRLLLVLRVAPGIVS